MPIAERLVNATVEEDLGAAPRDALQDMVLIDGYQTGNEPTAGFLNPTPHSDAQSVADDYGEDSDLQTAASQYFADGADTVQAMAVEFEEHSETFDATDQFQLSNVPVSGLADVTVTIDGTEAVVYHTVQSPVSLEDAQSLYAGRGETDPDDSAETVALNNDTGEGTTSTSGSIEVTYSTISWTDVFGAVDGRVVDGLDLANHSYGYESIGEMDTLAPWQAQHQAMRAQVYHSAQLFDRPEHALQLAQDVGAYAPSAWTLPITHESPTEAIGAKALGKFAVEDAGYNIFQEDFDVAMPSNPRLRRFVGEPGEAGSLENGDDGSGPSNVIYSDNGDPKLSNSLTTAGLSDDYRYLDRVRRKAYALKRIVRSATERLQDGAQFDSITQAAIEGAIEDELRSDVGEGEMFLDMSVTVPPREETSQSDRSNRIWSGVRVELTLNEPVHRLNVTIVLTL
ncbi:hypothetical protein [Saliphagus sp. LR7]|uniref:hypothetical protein n=1 Tax=Saliphagus sp. LR7 TaxID=2282654 RepID=UPI0013007F03|nr:hypothetical protein [Saliphagus sp. LR7]